MANEFIARNGLIAQNNSTVTGSLNVTGGITGSLLGTASTASYVQTAQTASYVQTAQTASYVLQAVSSSYTITASYALNGGGGGASFPYTGSAIITGSLIVTGSTTSTLGFTGSLQGTSSYAITASFISNPLLITNRQTGSYTLVLSDAGKLIEMNSGSTITLTVPTSSTTNFDIGTQMMITQYGIGQLSILTGSANVFVRSAGYRYKLSSQYSGATLVKIAIDEWYLFGDLAV